MSLTCNNAYLSKKVEITMNSFVQTFIFEHHW